VKIEGRLIFVLVLDKTLREQFKNSTIMYFQKLVVLLSDAFEVHSEFEKQRGGRSNVLIYPKDVVSFDGFQNLLFLRVILYKK
jgi:hypothetical protein